MARHVIHSTFEITRSRDSGWQEWSKDEKYLFDDASGQVIREEYECFSNTRRPSEDYERLTSTTVLTPSAVPGEVKEKILKKFPEAKLA